MLLRILTDRSSSYDARALALDTMSELAADPSFFPELYVNYDCDLYGSVTPNCEMECNWCDLTRSDRLCAMLC